MSTENKSEKDTSKQGEIEIKIEEKTKSNEPNSLRKSGIIPGMKPNGNKPIKRKIEEPKFNWFWIMMIAVFAILIVPQFIVDSNIKKINETEFFSYLKQGYVKEVVLDKSSSKGEVYLNEIGLKNPDIYKAPTSRDNIISSLSKTPPQFTFTYGDLEYTAKQIDEIKKEKGLKTEVIYDTESPMESIFITILIYAGIFGLLYFLVFRRMGAMGGGAGGQIFNIGKSRAKLFDENDHVKVTFENVAGLEGAKEEIQEIVDFLKNPDKYTKLGGKIPKGALLVGPPGTGKTLLAKAVAGEAQVPFFSLSGSDFVEMFVGVGASRVRDLFHQAKVKSPAIIFIDEIDAIGRARGKGAITGGNDERENTLNQLLTEMDGFGTDTNVIVLAATNRADVLDKALMRAGRFDRTIFVDLPDLNERMAIFNVHLKNLKLDKNLDISFLARQTPGFSGADIANVCNEAALIAARKDKETIEKQDFLDAVDRIIGGLEKKNKIIKPHEKRRVAFHEAGHATVSWLLEHAAPLVKVTIVPRGRSLGAAWYLPDEKQLTTTEEMHDELCATLGGRAAEEVVFGNISTGALSDLERVTKQATAMVTIYGLNKKVGNISYYDSSGQNEYAFNKPYSENTSQVIDTEISKIIEEQYERAKQILSENKDKLTALAEKLLEEEVIFREDLEKIFGKRPFMDHFEEMEIKLQEEKDKKAAEELNGQNTAELNNELKS